MICERCKVTMVKGQAIATDNNQYCRGEQLPMITYRTLRLIDVYKCPSCGHTADNKPYGTK